MRRRDESDLESIASYPWSLLHTVSSSKGARIQKHHNSRPKLRREGQNNSSRKQTSISLWSRVSGSRIRYAPRREAAWITRTTIIPESLQHYGTARPSLSLAHYMPRKVTRASSRAYRCSSTRRDASGAHTVVDPSHHNPGRDRRDGCGEQTRQR